MKRINVEQERLERQIGKGLPTALWGPYLSERQWGTVREDYSSDGNAWDYLSHEQARSKAYRWGEDGIAGISDQQCQLCFAPSFWNGKDPILKERLFGLTNAEGNHGEDVKELYYYLDNLPTHSYMHYRYKYPQKEFPYAQLVRENNIRSGHEPEYELIDTGIFDSGDYFDIDITYAKADEEDICIIIELRNHSQEAAPLTVLPTLWFRKQWAPDLIEGKPQIMTTRIDSQVSATHPMIGKYYLYFDQAKQLLFTENETNEELLYGVPNDNPFVKDAFHSAVIKNDFSIFKDKIDGTKFAPLYHVVLAAGRSTKIKLRISRAADIASPLGAEFDNIFARAKDDADRFYDDLFAKDLTHDQRLVSRQAYAGLLWNKQFYYYDVRRWLAGDPGEPAPPAERLKGRNSEWKHLNNRDIISVPDKWEFPWYASWDLAFHMVAFAQIDPEFAKQQLILINREWFTRPNGQIPAYEWNFNDVNPPVQAWAAMRVYEIDKKKTGKGDIAFLKRIFQKLTINFTWWANRKDAGDNYVFEGGFLGLDNIGVIDRDTISQNGMLLEQADGTAWMGMFSTNLLQIALEISLHDETYLDVALKYFEQYCLVAESLNTSGLWDEQQNFFYDRLRYPDGKALSLKVRSVVGMTSILGALHLSDELLDKLKPFNHGIEWYQKYCEAQGLYVAVTRSEDNDGKGKLISLIHQERLRQLISVLLDEEEFLSPYGIRSVSKIHFSPYTITINDQQFSLQYEPGESTTRLFGGNSNWRGPLWFPMNYLIVDALANYYQFFGEEFKMEFPSNSNHFMNLREIAHEINLRLQKIFLPDEHHARPIHGKAAKFYSQAENSDLVLFNEYFHGETGAGLGASHQTGWTALVATLIGKSN